MSHQNYLKRTEFVPFAPTEPGGQVHIHHCKEGKNNDRLYIKLTDDGRTVLAYCHHCGARGAASADSHAIPTFRPYRRSVRRIEKELPWDASCVLSDWETEAKLWISKYEITEFEVKEYEICYSPINHQIFFSRRKQDGTFGFMQSRLLRGDGPKYITHKLAFDEPSIYFLGNLLANKAILVEDFVSAVKCARHNVCAIPLLGTNLRETVLAEMLKHNFKEVLIYLDNDNKQVVANSNKLLMRLRNLYNNVIIVPWVKDPKSCTDKELKGLIEHGI